MQTIDNHQSMTTNINESVRLAENDNIPNADKSDNSKNIDIMRVESIITNLKILGYNNTLQRYLIEYDLKEAEKVKWDTDPNTDPNIRKHMTALGTLFVVINMDNPNMSFDWCLKYNQIDSLTGPSTFNIGDFYGFSSNIHTTITTILNNPGINRDNLLDNPNITVDDIINHRQLFPANVIISSDILERSDITIDRIFEIQNMPNISFKASTLFKSKHITLNHIKTHPLFRDNEDDSYSAYSKYTRLPKVKDVRKSYFTNCVTDILMNPNITYDIISNEISYYNTVLNQYKTHPEHILNMKKQLIDLYTAYKDALNIEVDVDEDTFNEGMENIISLEQPSYIDQSIRRIEDILNVYNTVLKEFAHNINLTWESVVKNIEIWTNNWEIVLKHKNIKLDILKHIFINYKNGKYIHKNESNEITEIEFEIKHIFGNPNITLDFIYFCIYKNPNLDYTCLSSLTIINEKFVEFCDAEEIKLDYDVLSQNPCISISFMMENIHYGWSIKNMSLNPNLTYDDIKKYPKINWLRHNIENNLFTYNSYVYKTRITNIIGNSSFVILKLIPVLLEYI